MRARPSTRAGTVQRAGAGPIGPRNWAV